MLNYRHIFIIVMINYLPPLVAVAQSNLNLSAIWQATQSAAPEITAAEQLLLVSQMAQKRQAAHWTPNLEMRLQSMHTDHPPSALFSWMGAGDLTNTDLTATALNDPGAHLFNQGTLSITLPLYEGGTKQALAKQAQQQSNMQALQLQQARLHTYLILVDRLACLIINSSSHQQVLQLHDEVDKLLSNYRLGQRQNPLGYSGMLGLRNVLNQATTLMNDNQSQILILRRQLEHAAPTLPPQWQFNIVEIQHFLTDAQGIAHILQPTDKDLLTVQAAQSTAAIATTQVSNQRGRWLPQLGLRAATDIYAGGRGYGGSMTAGGYFYWQLLSADQLHIVAEAKQQAAAAATNVAWAQQQQQQARLAISQQHLTLIDTLKRLNESQRLLTEQSKIARDLFHSGAINALHLAEVMARRLELLQQRYASELHLSNNYISGLQYGWREE